MIATLLAMCVLLTLGSTARECWSSSLQGARRCATSTNKGKAPWKPAVYQSLRMGRSRRSDVLRVLGPPDFIEAVGGKRPEIWYTYKRRGEFGGDLVVVLGNRNEVVLAVEERLWQRGISVEEVIRRFGEDCVVTRYDFDDCLGDGESSPVFESDDGPLEVLEYRDRGIAIFYNFEGKVDSIEYLDGPVGTKSSRCARRVK